MSRAPSRPVLRYHGGKWRLAPWVIGHFPKHRTYVEPYCGAASVLMQKPRCYSEVINDLDGDVVNLFEILRDPARASNLETALRLTPFARAEFHLAYERTDDPVERARRLVVRSFQGFGSTSYNVKNVTGFRKNANRQGTTPALDWSRYPECVPAFVARLQGVIVEQLKAVDVIRQHDREDTLVYADPPYPHRTRKLKNPYCGKGYVHEMTDDDHRQLAQVLREVKGMVVLSGYPCDLYDVELYPDWIRVETHALIHGATWRTECLWLSPSVSSRIQPSLFGDWP